MGCDCQEPQEIQEEQEDARSEKRKELSGNAAAAIFHCFQAYNHSPSGEHLWSSALVQRLRSFQATA
jgi:hypothetical protein